MTEWTVEELHEHLTALLLESDRRYGQRFEAQQEALSAALTAQEKAVQAALSAADRAVSKAELAAERRFEAVNEFRGQLADQAATLLPRSEADVEFRTLREKVDALENWRSRAGGVAAVLALFAGVVGAAVLRAFGG